eukprot:GDKI01019828.1.p1 GENE.GDKI01019828.1~~GDKI01019828.1.p1  ORF type:complete len:340 (+),score=49.26 GDKI01019828.1:51-1070(+)
MTHTMKTQSSVTGSLASPEYEVSGSMADSNWQSWRTIGCEMKWLLLPTFVDRKEERLFRDVRAYAMTHSYSVFGTIFELYTLFAAGAKWLSGDEIHLLLQDYFLLGMCCLSAMLSICIIYTSYRRAKASEKAHTYIPHVLLKWVPQKVPWYLMTFVHTFYNCVHITTHGAFHHSLFGYDDSSDILPFYTYLHFLLISTFMVLRHHAAASCMALFLTLSFYCVVPILRAGVDLLDVDVFVLVGVFMLVAYSVEFTSRSSFYYARKAVHQHALIEQQNAQIHALMRNQAVTFAKIAHDLRTPLNGVINSTHFLRDALPSGGGGCMPCHHTGKEDRMYVCNN